MANFMDSLWDSVWFQDQVNAGTRSFNVIEHVDRFEVSVAYPGATDVNVSVKDNILSLKLERKVDEVDPQTAKYHVKGINNYTFSKNLSLTNANIDENKITSSYKKGILNITMPKNEAAQPKVIEVKVEE
tara:strand:+ start:324 stop:713 length:390 start_codon:yes stop_codon:yes gene_type:complete